MPKQPLPPFYDGCAQILILGSFPSVQSRQAGFYYANPRNRFWQVLAVVYGTDIPPTRAARQAFLRARHIALWDVVASCEISGSSDSSIRAVIANDLRPLLAQAPIERIYLNGQTAARLYQRHIYPQLGRAATPLPSTSPANAAWPLERLAAAWRCIAG